MTTEEKAKKYDEALEWMRGVYPTLTGAAQEDAKHFFPELAESEDERIRKNCIHFLELQKTHHADTSEIDDCIAYLEKQKINTEGDFARGYDCGYEACLNSHGAEWFEKQKEQKPTNSEKPKEWSEEDEKMRDRILEILNKYGNIPVSGGKVQLRFNKEYMWLRHLYERFSPQPHWKPSEEQMNFLLAVINDPNNIGAESCYMTIKSLYNDLKKL